MKNQHGIEDHLGDGSEEFICVTDCNPEPSLIEEMKRGLTWLKYTTGLAATETLVGGYLTSLFSGRHPCFIAIPILAAGLLGYSAYHTYDTSKKIEEMEKKLETDKTKTS